MKQAATAVIEFNHDLLLIEPRPIAPMSDDEFDHLLMAFKEEFFDELTAGHNAQDVVVMVDSIIDGIYFAIGGLYKMGLTADQIEACFMHVHAKNMEKRRGKVAHRDVGDVPDAVKPEGFIPAEVEITKILGLGE